MADIVTVDVQGLEELRRYLNSENAIKHAKIGLKAAAAELHGVLKIYPPKTAGNMPRGFNTFYNTKTHKPMNTWYERNFGPKWARKDGSVGGSETSKDLMSSWTQKPRNSGLTQVIGTDVKYAPFVMDKDNQNYWHGVHGWKTVQTIAKEQEDRCVSIVRNEIAKAFHTK